MTANPSPDEGVRAALEEIIAIDQHESRVCVDYDPAGSTYAVTKVDGPCAEVARKTLAALSTPVPVIPMGTGDAIREALGAHIQADAYRDSFPDDDADLASNRQSEAWWRLKAREWMPDGIDHECAEAAKARILRENGNG